MMQHPWTSEYTVRSGDKSQATDDHSSTYTILIVFQADHKWVLADGRIDAADNSFGLVSKLYRFNTEQKP